MKRKWANEARQLSVKSFPGLQLHQQMESGLQSKSHLSDDLPKKRRDWSEQ